MLQTRVCDLLGIRYPIVQGGLAHLALSDLCVAVSQAGGLGQITAATMAGPDHLRQELRAVKAGTERPFGVNFAMGIYRNLDELVEVVLEEGAPVFTITGGNPEALLKRVQGSGLPIKTLVLVAGTRAAQKAEALGADAVIAVGFDGGGHLGRDDTGTMALIPRVVDAVRIPVLASGGISDGRGLVAALALGAEGIEMGTRFVAVQECAAHPSYKEALVQGKETDTVVIERPIGRPARVLKNPWVDRILAVEAEPGITAEKLYPYVGREANRRGALEGNFQEGYVYAGQGAGLIRDVPTVAVLFERMIGEARLLGSRLHGLLT